MVKVVETASKVTIKKNGEAMKIIVGGKTYNITKTETDEILGLWEVW